MAGLADKVQIDETISGQNQEEWKLYTNDKNVAYVVDQQNGSYSNQVSWDLSSVVNQNAWMSLQESYVLMPFNTTASFSAQQTNPISSKFLSLKDNFVNFVDSIQLFVNGQQLVDQTTYSNMPLQVLDKLTMSQDDLVAKGSGLNISPDTTTSIRFKTSAGLPAASTGGDGYRNNMVQPTANNQDPTLVNNGLQKRMLSQWDPSTTDAPPALSTAALDAQILAPYFSNDAGTKKFGSWSYVVYLPLKRLSDLLAKYPLVKGSQVRLVINFNSSISTLTVGASTPATYVLTANPTLTSGNTVTHIATDSNIGLGGLLGVGATCTITTAIKTSVTASPAAGYSQLPNCRVYIPLYKINPTYEARLLSNRKQTIKYMDWYQQPILNVSTGASFSQTLTTALPNVQMLIMIPFQNGSTGMYVNATCPEFQSCFSTAPATSMPGGMLAFQNFNIQVNGVNTFNQNQNYVYDNWVQEVQKIGINGGLSREISSGLIGLNEWIYSPFVIADISRKEENALNSYQSVVVQGTNSSGKTVDYYCFIGYQKEIEIDILTGAVTKLF